MIDFDKEVEKACAYAVGSKLYRKWRLNPTHRGARALLLCGAVAASKASRGEEWSASAIIGEYAAWSGSTASAVRSRIIYALRAAGIETGPVGAVIILGHTRVWR